MTDLNRYYQMAELIAAYIADEDKVMPPKLAVWLAESDENREFFERLTAEGHLKSSLQRYNGLDLEAGWERVSGQLFTAQEHKVVPLWKRVVAVSAVAAIVFGVWFFSVPRYSGEGGNPGSVPSANDVAPGKNRATLTLANGKVINLDTNKTSVVITDSVKAMMMLTASTPRGGTYQFALPDGTQVWLNADSKINFPSQFTEAKRRILLEGEAYFQVAKDKLHPFVVESKGQQVEVLGTHFNINAYNDESSVKTTLLEGSVKVVSSSTYVSSLSGRTNDSGAKLSEYSVSSEQSIILIPNQQAILKGKTFYVKTTDPSVAIAWKKGEFVFNEEPLQDIMRRVARWYDVEVFYENVDKNKPFGGYVSRFENISKVLEKLELTGSLHFKIEGRRVTVSK